MMKKVYLYLTDGTFSTDVEIPDGAPQPPLSTSIPIPEGIKKPVFKDGSWHEKQNDKEPKYSDILVPIPTKTEELLMTQSQQIASLQSMVMSQNQANAKLQVTNQQQANKIKQLQQMMMNANQQQAVAKSKEEK